MPVGLTDTERNYLRRRINEERRRRLAEMGDQRFRSHPCYRSLAEREAEARLQRMWKNEEVDRDRAMA